MIEALHGIRLKAFAGEEKQNPHLQTKKTPLQMKISHLRLEDPMPFEDEAMEQHFVEA